MNRFGRPVPPLVMEGHDGPITEIAIVPGTQRIISVGEDARVCVWDEAELTCTFGPLYGPLHSVAVSPDGKYIAAGNQAVTRWDMEERRLVSQTPPFPATVESLAFSPDSGQLAVGVRYEGVTIVSVTGEETASSIPGADRNDRLLLGAFRSVGIKLRVDSWR